MELDLLLHVELHYILAYHLHYKQESLLQSDLKIYSFLLVHTQRQIHDNLSEHHRDLAMRQYEDEMIGYPLVGKKKVLITVIHLVVILLLLPKRQYQYFQQFLLRSEERRVGK